MKIRVTYREWDGSRKIEHKRKGTLVGFTSDLENPAVVITQHGFFAKVALADLEHGWKKP